MFQNSKISINFNENLFNKFKILIKYILSKKILNVIKNVIYFYHRYQHHYSGFLWVLQFLPPIKVALNTIKLNLQHNHKVDFFYLIQGFTTVYNRTNWLCVL